MIYQAPEMQPVQAKPTKPVKEPKPPKQAKGAIRYPHRLFDYIKAKHNLKSDAALSHLVDITTPELSRVRSGVSHLSSRMILSIYDGAGMTIEEIRELI